MSCSIRCRTADTPRSECECSCGGVHHGNQSSITNYGSESIDTRDPFESVEITEDGLQIEEKRETLDSVEQIDVGDRVDVIEQEADGWKRHYKLEVESVQDGEIGVTKDDGFFVWIPASQIPADQFNRGDTQ